MDERAFLHDLIDAIGAARRKHKVPIRTLVKAMSGLLLSMCHQADMDPIEEINSTRDAVAKTESMS